MTIQDKSVNINTASITVDQYHQRSKHRLQKYAQGPDALDWDTQPDPFRNFEGCPSFALPLLARNLDTEYNDIFHHQRIEPVKFDTNSLGALFELSMGLSAWKVHGSERWALRVVPSSGNLHPTESYIVFSGTNIIPPGIYHYHSYNHCLEQRCNLKAHDDELNSTLPKGYFVIGLSSIHWREAWKYGERAFRYCQHDVGHAIAAIRYACAVLGWHVTLLDQCSDSQISTLLGLQRSDDFQQAESETPDVLLLVNTNNVTQSISIDSLAKLASQAEWKGKANCLSPDNRIHWDVIEQINTCCEKPETQAEQWLPPYQPEITNCDTDIEASSIIRHRRSAQSFDKQTIIPLKQFYRILDSLLPREKTTPFDTLRWNPRVHLILFVHRVEGLKPGLYVFPRSESGQTLLKSNLRNEFDWSRPPICPDTLPLYHLVSANSQNAARTASCHQSIASDGAFTVCMLAEYKATIKDKPWQYKQLFWEAGIIGQALYLEAEAIGMRGTGIGCYFDDTVHEILGIKDSTLQVVYHFTVGTPVNDSRLISLPPYSHLEKNK